MAEARQKLFNNIAPVYDELNDRLSFGQHWVWKRMAVKWSGAKLGQKALDVCCGSGDIAMLLAQAVGAAGEVGPGASQPPWPTAQAPCD
jgi:demethylmenaquinone methyltransferase/2-methoxy-6-polyprenyl-1,4-benzoquinol methylase